MNQIDILQISVPINNNTSSSISSNSSNNSNNSNNSNFNNNRKIDVEIFNKEFEKKVIKKAATTPEKYQNVIYIFIIHKNIISYIIIYNNKVD